MFLHGRTEISVMTIAELCALPRWCARWFPIDGLRVEYGVTDFHTLERSDRVLCGELAWIDLGWLDLWLEAGCGS